MSPILLRFARPQCLAATHLSSPEVGNGLSWPKPQCTCNAMVTSQAQHSTNEGVLRSNSACSMLMSDDLRLPRRGIEPRHPGSEASTLPLGHLPSLGYIWAMQNYIYHLCPQNVAHDYSHHVWFVVRSKAGLLLRIRGVTSCSRGSASPSFREEMECCWRHFTINHGHLWRNFVRGSEQ